MKNNQKKKFMRFLRTEREKIGMTQGQLAEKIGIASDQLARFERGERGGWDSIAEYMTALDLEFTDTIFLKIVSVR